MQTQSQLLVPALVTMSAGLWMVRAGIAKRRLAWRKSEKDRRRRR
jgi:hypothetical protein